MNRNQQIPDIVKQDILLLTKNTETMSNDEIITILSNIIEREIEKEAPNNPLVEECSRVLEELTPSDIKLTLQALSDNCHTLLSKQNPPTKTKPRRMNIWKVLPLVAACILLLCFSLNIVAVYGGYKNAWDFVNQKAEKFFNLNSGTTFGQNEITFSKPGLIKTYPDISILLRQESLDILYPASLPKDLAITKVELVLEKDENKTIYFVFNHAHYSMIVTTDPAVDINDLSSYPVFEFNEKTYYLLERPEICQAICHDGVYEYTISAPGLQQLKDLIKNLKENN